MDLAKSNYTSNYNAKQVKVNPLLQNFKESINYLLDNPNLADDTLIILKLREFVQLLLRQENKASILEFFSSLFQPVEYDFKSTIENNVYSNLTIEEFAKLCNMSVSTFKRKFSKVYETTPKHYFLQQKLDKAKNLLLRSELSITQIAYECGFDSISVFNRNFKRMTNLSPTAFRKTLLNLP